MALIGRMARLLSADLHAVMDSLEEPEVLLRQAIREMEDDIADSRRLLARRRATIDELSSRKQQIEGRIAKLDGELDLCFQADEEPLARSLVRRKLQLERLFDATIARLSETNTEFERDAARHERCEQALSEMKERAEIVAARPRQEQTGIVSGALDEAIGSDEIDAALMREKQARRPS